MHDAIQNQSNCEKLVSLSQNLSARTFHPFICLASNFLIAYPTILSVY